MLCRICGFHGGDYEECYLMGYKNPVHTSQETHCVSATEPNRLMLFWETVAVYCENHMEDTNPLCGQTAEFSYVQTGGTYSNHWFSKRLNSIPLDINMSIFSLRLWFQYQARKQDIKLPPPTCYYQNRHAFSVGPI
jgi:hypothetical protein